MDNKEQTYVYTDIPKETNNVEYVVETKKKGWPTWLKAVVIILAVIVFGLIISNLFSNTLSNIFGNNEVDEVNLHYNYDYIASIYVQGEINEASTGAYNHGYLLDLVNELKTDEHNKGILLWINTPGGTVFASDELYLMLKSYKEETGKPIYSSYQSQVTSGGYYISCMSDKIYANRNCWTGSIGVTMGTFIDVSGLLEKLGVKTNTITAGRNKAMGGYFDEMTDEQKEIFQSLVDDAYEQFVGIVADGRNMEIDYVKELADGRIYTAKQAIDNGLIDGIATYDETIEIMCNDLGEEIPVVEFITYEKESLLPFLESDVSKISQSELEKLIDMNGTFELSYMCELRK